MNAHMAEQSVLGCILVNPDVLLPRAMEILTAEDFSLPECGHVFTALNRLFMERRPVDTVTVLAQLGGGEEYKIYLAHLLLEAPSPAHFDSYVEIIAEDARRRQAEHIAMELQISLTQGSDLNECQGMAERLMRALSTTRDAVCVGTAEGFMQVYSSIGKPIRYIRTGFPRLDKYTCIDQGDYVVVGGRPSSGKTALTLQILLNMAREHKAVYFSLETRARKIYDRLLSCFAHVPLAELKSGQVRDCTALAESYDRFNALKLDVVEAAGWTVSQIRAKAVQLGAEIIFIDYLSLIKAEGRSMIEKVTNISIALHTMAQQLKIAVVALSQLNRDAKSGEPDMANLRESGQVEQDADVVLLLSVANPEEEHSDRRLRIAKNKEGQTGCIRLSFAGGYQTFREVEFRE